MLVIDRPTEQTFAAITAFAESPFRDGYCAYIDRRGPGIGILRSIGWLQAWRDEQAVACATADERLDANDSHYRWQY